jgi:hypothetical protein
MRCLSAIFALAAVTIILVSSTHPASAGLVSAEDFQVIESVGSNGNGYYTVINNSDDEYIYAFSVTNPQARSVGDWTSEKGLRSWEVRKTASGMVRCLASRRFRAVTSDFS